MASLAKAEPIVAEFDIDAELDDWLEKTAEKQGLDPRDMRQMETEVWERWRRDQDPQDFAWLYNSHQPLLYRSTERIVRSTTLPKEAVRSRVLRNYVKALDTFDPTRGTQLSSYVYGKAGERLGRYVQRYTNVGRIPEDRAGLIDLMQNREAELREQIGRKPSDVELADDMLLASQDLPEIRAGRISPKAVGTLRRELRRDLLAEEAGGEATAAGDSLLEQQAVFLHGSLNPEQQTVLEHTFAGFGKDIVVDPMELADKIELSPQKIRAIKKQIANKLKRYY